MATATARVPVLMSPMEKNLFVEKAQQAGISLGELFRRAAASYQTRENDTLLEGMIIQMQKSTAQAENAIDDALAFVEKSNRRIAQMEISGKKNLMGVTEKMWDALTTIIKMNDKVERMAGTMKTQQEKIENLTARIIRLETALEIALSSGIAGKPSPSKRLEHKT